MQSQSVSLTLEIAYDDWCVAQNGKATGKNKDVTLLKDSTWYKNPYDSQTRFFRAKDDKGD
ncbi:MAG: glycoside hydrolase family 92 protein [Chitinophagaceae bacterium]|nr:glycoside hydrolase family 92 protein [Chitinophagaceae bacterium]